MKPFIILQILILVLENHILGQDISRTTYDNRFIDLSHAIVQTYDGGYVVAGKTFSTEQGQMVGLVIKFDAGCNLTWKKEIVSGTNRWLEIFDVAETHDQNLLLTGRELSTENNSFDLYVCKLDKNGEIIWKNTFGGPKGETGYKILPVSGDDIMIVGTTNSCADEREKMLITRIDGSGNLKWSKMYGEDQSEEAYSIAELRDGGFVVIGTCNTRGGRIKDLTVMKLDGSGNLIWHRTLESSDIQVGFNAIEDMTGNILVSGISKKKNKCKNNLMVTQFSQTGAVTWIKELKMDGCVGSTSMAISGNDEIFVGGTLFNFKSDQSWIFIIKMDLKGKTIWKKTIGETGNETCNAMILNKKRELVIAGEVTGKNMNMDILLLKVSVPLAQK